MKSESISTLFRLPVNVISPSDDVTVIEGDSLNLTCNGEHFTYRQWTRVLDVDSLSEVVSTTDDGRIEVTSDYQLLFWWIDFVKLCSSFPLKFYSCIPEFCTYYSFTVSLLFSKNAHDSSYS